MSLHGRFPRPLKVSVNHLIHTGGTKEYRLIEFTAGTGRYIGVFEWGAIKKTKQYKSFQTDDFNTFEATIEAKLSDKLKSGYRMNADNYRHFLANSFEELTKTLNGSLCGQLSENSEHLDDNDREMTRLEWLLDNAPEVVRGRLTRQAQQELDDLNALETRTLNRINAEIDFLINETNDDYGMF